MDVSNLCEVKRRNGKYKVYLSCEKINPTLVREYREGSSGREPLGGVAKSCLHAAQKTTIFCKECLYEHIQKVKQFVHTNGVNQSILLTFDNNVYLQNMHYISGRHTLNEKVIQKLKNIQKKYDKDLKYVFIPDISESGRYHLHGFIKFHNEEAILRWKQNQSRLGRVFTKLIHWEEQAVEYMYKIYTRAENPSPLYKNLIIENI